MTRPNTNSNICNTNSKPIPFLFCRLSIALIINDTFDTKQVQLRLFPCNQSKPTNSTNDDNSANCELKLSENESNKKSYFPKSLTQSLLTKRLFKSANQTVETKMWSNVYFDCNDRRWFITYNALILEPDDVLVDDEPANQTKPEETEDTAEKVEEIWFRVKGVISADVDVTQTDINQCDTKDHSIGNNEDYTTSRLRFVINLSGTHKCHQNNSKVSKIFLSSHIKFFYKSIQ